MFFIPGFLIATLTFPGVIVHEIAHRMFCDWARVPVYKVCYFRVGTPSGFVVHGPVNSLRKSFLISIGPLIVNTILCMMIMFSVSIPLFFLHESGFNPLNWLLAWLGISIGMNAFPSNQDMTVFMEEVKRTSYRGPLFFVAKAFSGLVMLANVLRVVWFHAIYAVAISALLPFLLLQLLT